tara:strand:+ start:4235 stop:4429 length:195 start_codon:yes stop_codon:yes gene_type:complete
MILKEDWDQAQEAIKKNPNNPDIKCKVLFIFYAHAYINGNKAILNKWEEIMGPYQEQWRAHSGD